MKKQLLSFQSTLIAFGFLFSFHVNSQIVQNVITSGMTFSPANMKIDVGDTVRWTSASGTHNVNGTLATYPSNPESFGNSLGSGWTYSHKFLTAGSYDYRCDQHFSSGMVGTITVLPAGSIKELYDNENYVKVFPNPSNDNISVTILKNISFSEYIIYDLSGTEVMQGNFTTSISIYELKKCVFFLSLIGEKTVRTKIFF